MKAIVYVSEDGKKYTYDDIIELAKGNQMYADMLIGRASWAHIEHMIQEDLKYGEIKELDGTYVLTDWDKEGDFFKDEEE